MKISIYSALLLVLTISCQPTSSEPGLVPLAAFKAGLVAGILKSLNIQSSSGSQSSQSFRGTASGDLAFSGSLTRNRNQHINSGHLQLSGNVNYSGQRRPISSNGSGTRRQSLRGNVTFNGNIRPVQPVTNAQVVSYVSAPVETYTVRPITGTAEPTYVAAISSGHNAAEVNAVRSNNGRPNVNINVANAGSGTGAIINLNGDGTGVLPPDSRAAAVRADSSTFDDFSSFSTTSDDSFVSTDDTFSDLPFDTDSSTSDTFGNEFDTTADNEVVPQIDFDYSGTETDLGGTDFSTNFEENTDSAIATDFGFETTTKTPNRVDLEFNASGSGFIRGGNGVRGSGNLAFDSSISTSGGAETPTENTDFEDYNTFAENDSTDFNTDTANFASGSNTDFTSDYDGGFISDQGTDSTTTDFNSDLTSDFSPDSTSGFNTDFTSEFSTDSTSDFNTDLTSDFSINSSSDSNTDFTSDFSTDSTSYLNSDFTSDFNTDLNSGFDADFTSDYSTDFSDTSVTKTNGPLQTNNDFEINTSGYVSETTDDNSEPSVAVSGTNTQLYDSYIQSNVDAIRALSDIAKTHGSGRPVSIRLRTAHRVRNPPQSSSALSSTAGGGLLGVFSDSPRYTVSQAPLLYRYTDIIESPDAVPSRQYHLSASASGNANLNLVSGRSLTEGRSVRMGRRPTTQGKSIPNRQNPTNTIAENVQRAQLGQARNNQNINRANNRPPSRQRVRVPVIPVNLRTKQTIPQRSITSNARRQSPQRRLIANAPTPSNRPRAASPTRNSNINVNAKSIANTRRQIQGKPARNLSEFSFLGSLANFAEAHRQSLLKTAASSQNTRSPAAHSNNHARRIARNAVINGNAGKNINNDETGHSQYDPVFFAPKARTNDRGMLYEANPVAAQQNSPNPTQIQNRLYALNQSRVSPILPLVDRIQNMNNDQISIDQENLSQGSILTRRGNLGIPTLPSNPKKTVISSLDRKKNSGITKAKLRYRYSSVISPPQL